MKNDEGTGRRGDKGKILLNLLFEQIITHPLKISFFTYCPNLIFLLQTVSQTVKTVRAVMGYKLGCWNL